MQLENTGEGVKIIYNPEDTNYPLNVKIKDFQGLCSRWHDRRKGMVMVWTKSFTGSG
jgi:hypothetical protein